MLADNIRPEYYRSKHRALPNAFTASHEHDDQIRTFNNGLNALTYLSEFSRKIVMPSFEMIVESSAFSQSLIGRPFFSMGSATDTLLLGSPEPPAPVAPDVEGFETEVALETELTMGTVTLTVPKSKSRKKKKSMGALKIPQTVDSKPDFATAPKSSVSDSMESIISVPGKEIEASKSKRRKKRRKKNKAQHPAEENVSTSIEEDEELKSEIKEEKEESAEDAPVIEKPVTESLEDVSSKEAETTDSELEKLRRKYCRNYAYEVVSEQEGEFREVVTKKRNRGVRANAPKQLNLPSSQRGRGGPSQAKSSTGQKSWRSSTRSAQAPPPTAGPSTISGRVQSSIHKSAPSSPVGSSNMPHGGPRKQLRPSYVSNETLDEPAMTSASQAPVASKEYYSPGLSSKPSAWSKPLYPQPVSSSQLGARMSKQPSSGKQPPSSVYLSAPKASEQPTRDRSIGRQKIEPASAADSSMLTGSSKSPLPAPAVPKVSAASTYDQPGPSIRTSSELTEQLITSPGQPKYLFPRSGTKPMRGVTILPQSDRPSPSLSSSLRGRKRGRGRARSSIYPSSSTAHLTDRPKMPAASDDPRPCVGTSPLPVEPLNPVQSESSEAQSQAQPSTSEFPASSENSSSLPHPYMPGGQVEGYTYEMSNVPHNLWVPPELSRQLVSLDRYMRSEWEEFQRIRKKAGKKCE